MGLLDDLLKSKGDPVKAANADVLMSYESRVKKINDLEDEIEGMTDDQLRQVAERSGGGGPDCLNGWFQDEAEGGGGLICVGST